MKNQTILFSLVNWDASRVGIATGFPRVATMSGSVIGQNVYAFGGWDGRFGRSDMFQYDLGKHVSIWQLRYSYSHNRNFSFEH